MGKTGNKANAARAAFLSLLCNLSLAGAKLAVGVIGGSAALVSDAVHSMADVFCTLITLIGIKISSKSPDSCHPYGHGRFENLFALALSVILAATGTAIGFGGAKRIITGDFSASPGLTTLIAAAACAVIKELAYRYTRRAALRTASDSLLAEAWHHRTDALASLGSFLGVLGARAGMPALDSAACLVICALVLRAAAGIFWDSVKKLADTACDDTLCAQILETALAQEGVLSVDSLRTRVSGGEIHVDIEIGVDGGATVSSGHRVAHCVCDMLMRLPAVSSCMAHVNPRDAAALQEGFHRMPGDCG